MTANRPGFDDVDLTTMTVVELAEYLAQLGDAAKQIANPFVARAYNLRRAEVEAKIGEVERRIAIHNANETERLEPQ